MEKFNKIFGTILIIVGVIGFIYTLFIPTNSNDAIGVDKKIEALENRNILTYSFIFAIVGALMRKNII